MKKIITILKQHFSSKDLVILILFFLFVLAITSFAVFAIRLDETPYESMFGRELTATVFAGTGFVLLLPLALFTMPIFLLIYPVTGGGGDLHWHLLPWFAATLYTMFLALGLMMFNARRTTKK